MSVKVWPDNDVFLSKTQDKERRFPMLVSYVQNMQFWFDLEIDDAIIHKSGPEWLAWVSHVVVLIRQLHELIVSTLTVKFRKLQFLKEPPIQIVQICTTGN